MLLAVLKRCFWDTAADESQSYGFLGFPKPGENSQQHRFDRMVTTIDLLPDELRVAPLPYLPAFNGQFETITKCTEPV